ncbi:hypothetical protein [Paracidovorax oryzae]|uniref:hypothetical protein n=1 Tax=Paracidovorax oryzae TaxID=862720 RepID=UPI00178C764B|nr:hypothetical protein [Paracidovorax oryzae]
MLLLNLGRYSRQEPLHRALLSLQSAGSKLRQNHGTDAMTCFLVPGSGVSSPATFRAEVVGAVGHEAVLQASRDGFSRPSDVSPSFFQ